MSCKKKQIGVMSLMLLVIIPQVIFAQESGLTQFTGKIGTSISTIYGYAKVAIPILSIPYAIYLFWHALVGEGEKSRYWWQVFGLAVFLIILAIFPAVFNSIMGTSVIISNN